MRTLTLEDRRKIELMWRRNASPVKIAAELEISQCTVYTELKRGQETDGGGGVVLDENFRPAYSAERGQTVYQMNLRNRGRRPKRGVEQKGADGVGIKEQLIFPEIQYDQVEKIRGMDICFVTTAKTDEEARELLRALGMPFKK